MMRDGRGIYVTFGVVIAVILLVAIVLAGVMNGNCEAAFQSSLKIYPGAEKSEEEAVFFGAHRVMYYTSDDLTVVNQWYETERNQQMRDTAASGNVNNLAVENWVTAGAQGAQRDDDYLFNNLSMKGAGNLFASWKQW